MTLLWSWCCPFIYVVLSLYVCYFSSFKNGIIIHICKHDHSVYAIEKCHCVELPDRASLIYCSSQMHQAHSALPWILSLSFSCHLLLIKHGIDFFFRSYFLHIKLYLTYSMSMLYLLSLYKALHVSLRLNCTGLISIAISIIWFQSDIPLCLRIFCKEMCVMFGSFDPSLKKREMITYIIKDSSGYLISFSLICF